MKLPRLLYAHGFASGPLSAKGRALSARCAARGQSLELLDLRVPTPSGLRLSSMIDVVRAAIGEGERAIAIGSSLGGLTVARAAERDARIVGCVLIAPAFRLVERWRARMGNEAWEEWRTRGTMPYADHASRAAATIDVEFAFMEDAASIDGDDATGAEDVRLAAMGLGRRWPDVRVPTVVIHGERDATVDPELSRAFARARPHVRLVELDDDHQMHASVGRIDDELTRMIALLDRAE